MKPDDEKKSQAYRISKIFNYIGGTLIFFGISYLLFNNWHVLATISRIFVTLGVACWALMMAVSLSEQKINPNTSAAFFLLGGLLLPLGLSITLNAMNLDMTYDIQNIIISGICFTVFLILQLRFTREILLLFSILFGSLFFMASTRYLNDNIFWLSIETLTDYQILFLGACYLLAGYFVSFNNSNMTGALYFFGDLLVLLASFQLGGLLIDDQTIVFWEMASPALVLLSFILSIPLQSNSLLYLGAIFLVVYITSMTHKFSYLFGTIGWPVMLIVAGIFLMFLGYIIVNMQKKIPKK